MQLNIAILPGDGIGPEVTAQAIKVLEAVCRRYGHSLQTKSGLIGACAIDACGSPFPAESLAVCRESDAVLFGAVGDPRYDHAPDSAVRPEQGLLSLRKELGLYANIRPVQTYPTLLGASVLMPLVAAGVNFIVVRELTGGMYFGEKGRLNDGNSAYDTNIYHRHEIERILHKALQTAAARRCHLTVVDKANVLETSRLWRQVAKEMEPLYPDVTVDYMYIDNAAMKILTNPAFFDVIVTENTFGDILTDEASCISGSMGIMPSASLGDGPGVYEPIHGSYPQAAGLNIANPMGSILSAAMMLHYSFGLHTEDLAIRSAVAKCIDAGQITEDLCPAKPLSTSEVGDAVAERILKMP